jgi:hypothetical protein
MNSKSSQASRDQHAYIPQHVSEAMSKQVQQNAPAHLKQYLNPDKPTYVPQHAQQQINQYMQKSMPGHMKSYAGAYVQQKIVQPGLTGVASQAPRPVTPHAPTPNVLRRDHSNVQAGQYDAQFHHDLFAAEQQPGQTVAPDQAYPPQQPQPPAGQPPAGPAPHPYDFIMNPEQPSGPKFNLPGLSPGSSMAKKLLYGLGGFMALLILFVIARSIFSGGSNLQPYVVVAQDQQEIIHLIENIDSKQDLPVSTQNFVATASASIASGQAQILSYLTTNKQKVKTDQLNLKINAATDQRLVTAASAGTYSSTFADVMKTELNTYMSDLSTAYKQSSGPKGRALLSSQYDQAGLMLQQLENPVN